MVNVLAQGPTTPLPQNQQKWNTNGNSVTTNDFIGTTNYTSLIFRTNNLKALEIDPNGDLFLKNLNGQGEGILKHDQNGKIDRIPFNSSFTQVLSSSGVWKEISTFTGLQVNNNDIVQTTTGNFGIGTSTPQAKLDVSGNVIISGSLLASNLKLGTPGNNFQINTLALPTGGSIAAFGITPHVIAECADEVQTDNFQTNRLMVFNSVNNNVVDVRNDGINGYIDFGAGISPIKSVNANRGLKINSYCHSNTSINENGGDVFLCKSTTGSVGIGTDLSSNTFNGIADYFKLSVNGFIRAKKVVVELGWSDFVFEKNYKLSTLAEVEKYIKANGHLPEMPTAKEIETNGGDLGNLVKLQMQKIEELTLYVIEQNKRIEELEKSKK